MLTNKKATIFLTFVSIFILIALLLFYSSHGTGTVFKTGKGELQLETLKTYQQAEKAMLYIDLAAKYSADKTVEDLNKQLTQDSKKKEVYDLFSDNFNKYMDEYIDKYTDEELDKEGEIIMPKNNYELLFKENHLIGIATQNIKINKKNINYSIKPSFNIELNYDIFSGKVEGIEEWEKLPDGEVELKIRAAASKYNIPQHIALGIAMQESSMEHYNPDGSVKMSNANCMGLMQVQLDSRDGTYNSMCSMSKEDLKNINNNIECGMKILKGKYNMVCDSNNNPLIRRYIGISEYELKVREWCKIDEHLNDYLEYDGDCDKMAIRAYNGLGCAENADVNYVERVLEHAAKYT
jgi:hypothetical protein